MDNQSVNEQIRLAEQHTDAKHRHLNTATYIQHAIESLEEAIKQLRGIDADGVDDISDHISGLKKAKQQEINMAESYDVEVRNLKQKIERLQDGIA